jgi:hypothetical protein
MSKFDPDYTEGPDFIEKGTSVKIKERMEARDGEMDEELKLLCLHTISILESKEAAPICEPGTHDLEAFRVTCKDKHPVTKTLRCTKCRFGFRVHLSSDQINEMEKYILPRSQKDQDISIREGFTIDGLYAKEESKT